MNYKWLKWGRVGIALIFFVSLTLIFLDFRDLAGEKGVQAITFLQFVPSLLKFISITGLSAIGFLIIVVLTVLFGRVYCSAICPLGILQDFISRAGKKITARKRYKFKKADNLLRNSILFISLLSAVLLSIVLVNFLDPYSIYGKIANQLFRPVGIWINNAFANALESINVYFLYKKDLHPVHFYGLAIPAGLLLVVGFMSGKYGRLYCNTICPVGTLLGWISKISLFRVQMNKDNCTQCGKCSFVCKAQCINIKTMDVDVSRCVSCFNCLTVCEDSAIDFKAMKLTSGAKSKGSDPVKPKADGRKTFLLTLIAGITGFSGLRKGYAASGGTEPLNKKPTTVPIKKTNYVSPPGSLSIDHLTTFCTACQLCVSQCPTGVLQPSFNEFGLSSIMQPFMDYGTNYCNFECIKCGDVCPTGAIFPLKKEDKVLLQLGKVNFIKENCVVYTENTACGSCSEHCPTQAVRMVPYKGSLTIPETNNDICVGCGACENACPVVPYKAIYVDGHSIHQTAQKPVQEKLEEPSLEEDFPF